MALKIAVVGMRGIGNTHAQCHSKDPLAKLVAVCDVVKERADTAAKKYGAKAYYNVDELLRNEDIDILDVTTGGYDNGSWHFEPAMQGLEAGKHVLVEKPLSNRIEEARQLVAKAAEKRLYLGCNLNHYFTPVADRAKKYQTDGQMGELISRMIRGDTKVDYLGLPEASKEKTLGGWLRSGDIVHRDAQGWYYFDFRKGTELRRAGDFIQPDHVERIIGEHPDVTEVCVYGIPAASGAPGECDLVAAVAPFEGKAVDPKEIFEVCRKSLEANFIPSYLQVVSQIPKTISEKALDRKLREDFLAGKGTIYRHEDYK